MCAQQLIRPAVSVVVARVTQEGNQRGRAAAHWSCCLQVNVHGSLVSYVCKRAVHASRVWHATSCLGTSRHVPSGGSDLFSATSVA
eukprot:6995999-Prymnesium_polylepis.1